MKKANFKYLTLLLLPVTGCVLIPYLHGRWVVSDGFYVSAYLGCAFLLPLIISLVLVPLLVDMGPKAPGWKVGAALFGTVAVQYAMTFSAMRVGSEWMMMLGVAHRLEREFSIGEVRKCAEDFRGRDKEGALLVKDGSPKTSGLMSSITRVIDQTQLPADLRGRFYCVRIGKEDTMSGDIYFEVGRDWGILCTTNHFETLEGRHLMADGVYAYYYRKL